MRTTVEHGLDWLEMTYNPLQGDAFVLAPADHPAINAQIVRSLVETYHANPARSIVVPVHAGRRGHPALIAWRHVGGIRCLPPGHGIDSYLRAHTAETRELPLAQAGILFDLDIPEDYVCLMQRERQLLTSGTP